MSVYIRKDSKDGTYSYEFQLQGRRFSGSTERTSEREAKQVERTKRKEAEQQLREEKEFSSEEMTFEIASSRYWLEVGQHHENAETTTWSLEWLENAIGKKTLLRDITDSKVAELVAKRRNELIPRRKRPVRIGPSTVNRTMTQPLREILIRAAKVWKVKVADIDWSEHLLKEPKERVREATPAEEAAILGELERGYDVAVKFAFLSGCRRMEIIGLIWSRVDFFSRSITVIGKGNKSRLIPMSKAMFDLLWAERDRHPDVVFTYEAKRTSKRYNLVRGKRYPLTESGLKTAMRRAVPDAGVSNFRFHDTRHTAATRILRVSNLRVAQKLLGHEDIKTTTKYAHAMVEDIRNGLDAMSPTESPTDGVAGDAKGLGEKKNSG